MSTSRAVLVVDDDVAILKLIERQLTNGGFWVVTASTWEKAQEVMQGTPLLAVLLDLSLKQKDDGFEALQQIKKMDSLLPVIIVTGQHDEAEGRRAVELGAFEYVTKPIDFTYLKNILKMQLPGEN